MYFKNFPQLSYAFEVDGQEKQILVSDITRNFRFLSSALKSIQLYDKYVIRDGETPDIISQKFYDTPNYHWVIMIANDKYDYVNDFPRTQQSLDKYIESKYGDDADEISFYLKNGRIVDYGTVGSTGITNRAYENLLNESKRSIKLISKELLNVVLKDFSRMTTNW